VAFWGVRAIRAIRAVPTAATYIQRGGILGRAIRAIRDIGAIEAVRV